jgi:multicomponent Na+:H+ antiporter subunit A
VAALGVVGYGMAILFAVLGAPDLAITQVVVDTLTIILFAFVFFRLPGFARLSRERPHLRDALVAGAAGGLLTMLMLVVASAEPVTTASQLMAELSVPAGHGRNVVNVVLVDFRSLDTLGEIVVLTIAGLGVYSLLRLRMHPE